MKKEELYKKLVAETDRLGIPVFDPNSLADMLLATLKEDLAEVPKSTQLTIALVVASLKKHHADHVMSGIQERALFQKLANKGPAS